MRVLSSLNKVMLLIATLYLLVSCTSKPLEIRIGISPWPGYGYFYLANELGYFNSERVKVELVDFSTLSDSSHAYERGQVDAWCTTTVELLMTQFHSTKRPVAVWITNISDGGDMLLARKDIHTLSELKGKKIGLEPATVDVVLLASALSEVNLAVSDVTIVPLSHKDTEKAFIDNKIDAAVSYPPESFDLEAMASVYRIYDSRRMTNKIVDLVAVEEEHLANNKEAWVFVIDAYQRAERFSRENPDQARQIMSRHLGLSLSQLEKIGASIKLISEDQQRAYLGEGGMFSLSLASTKEVLARSGVELLKIDTGTMYSDVLLEHQ